MVMITKKEIGVKIKEYRMKSGLSQSDLGRILNKSHAAISDIERGKTDLTVLDLLTIADHLQQPIGFFLNIQTTSSNWVIKLEKNNPKVASLKLTKSEDLDLSINSNP